MPKITELNICSGCHACFSICPADCIKMQENNEGFLYPYVNVDRCMKCGACDRVCPVLNPGIRSGDGGQAYACINKNEEVRIQSSSGGIFTLLAEKIIDDGGVVYGAAFDSGFNVCHICIENKEELSRLRGSKYVQSRIGTTYVEAKKRLDGGQKVLFTGTPCQID